MTIIMLPSTTRTDARERMIRSAASLFRRRGIEGTSFSDVLADSGAPRGSIYHHFPGGKAQLTEEAVAYAGDYIAAGLAAALRAEDPRAALRRFVETWTALLRDSGCAEGCPVVAGALEGDRSPGARAAAGTAFTRWEDLLSGAIEANGVAPARARSLATLAVAAIEGAVVIARAQRSVEPLERVGRELEGIVAAAVAA